MVLSVKLGYITLIKTRADLCEQMANVGKECPIEKGQLKVTKEVQMPDLIPNVSRALCTSPSAELI